MEISPPNGSLLSGNQQYICLLVLAGIATFIVSSVFIPRRPANDLDARLTAFVQERGRLWKLPEAHGGLHENDVSTLICPDAPLEDLKEIAQIDSEALRHVSVLQSSEWEHQFVKTVSNGLLSEMTLMVLYSKDGSLCYAKVQQYSGI